jgi:hypothetical protein
MWTPVLLGLVLAVQTPAAAGQTGAIAGRIPLPDGLTLAKPAQVVVLPPEYTEMWNTDVQERLDNYCEDFKPAFIQQKEYFLELEQRAYRDAFQFITRMQFDNRTRSSSLIHDSTPDGGFEFKNLPTRRYKILALGRVGDQEIVWADLVNLTSAVPIYVQLKKLTP